MQRPDREHHRTQDDHVFQYTPIQFSFSLTLLDIRGYIPCAVAKSAVGICTPDIIHGAAALAVFLCAKHSNTQIMVGRAGQPKGWPGS